MSGNTKMTWAELSPDYMEKELAQIADCEEGPVRNRVIAAKSKLWGVSPETLQRVLAESDLLPPPLAPSSAGQEVRNRGGAKPNHEPFRPYAMERASDIELNINDDVPLIEDVIDLQSLTVIYGASGSTKSFLAIEMGLAIASGSEWRGRYTEKGGVIYVGIEGTKGTRKRIWAALREYPLSPEPGRDFHFIPSRIGLDEPEDIDRLVRTVRAAATPGINVVIIDTLAMAMGRLNENEARDMGIATNACKRIMGELGCGVILVHHCGKDEARGARGSGALRNATDTELEVKQAPDGLCTITNKKERDEETGGEWAHRLRRIELGENRRGTMRTTAVIEPVSPSDASDAKARRASGGRKITPSVRAVVDACADLHNRGDAIPIPADVLAKSGYTAHVAKMGWDTTVTIMGFHRPVLRDLLRERDGDRDYQRDASEDARRAREKEQERVRQSIQRKIKASINARILWLHDGLVWLADARRDGA